MYRTRKRWVVLYLFMCKCMAIAGMNAEQIPTVINYILNEVSSSLNDGILELVQWIE